MKLKHRSAKKKPKATPGIKFVNDSDARNLANFGRHLDKVRFRAGGVTTFTFRPLSTRASTDVLAERARQRTAEGYTLKHDDDHMDGELAEAAAVYALTARQHAILNYYQVPLLSLFPGGWTHKPTNRRSDLVKAGALILADIERRDRALKRRK